MKKITVIAFALIMCISLCACNQSAHTDTSAPAGTSALETNVTDSAPTDVKYTITIPSGFVTKKLEDNISTMAKWAAPDYEETNYSITAYDVGHSTFVNDVIPSTFEEWSQKEGGNGIAHEKIFFEYKDGDKYEEYTVIAKITYTEGSSIYDVAKLDYEISELDVDMDESNNKEAPKFPEKIEKCFGRKVMIDKSDRSQAIAAVAESEDVGDSSECQKVLASFNWK